MGRKKVLITGAAGRIGEVMRQGLRECYDLRLMYHRTVREAAAGEEVVRGSVADLAVMVDSSRRRRCRSPPRRRPRG